MKAICFKPFFYDIRPYNPTSARIYHTGTVVCNPGTFLDVRYARDIDGHCGVELEVKFPEGWVMLGMPEKFSDTLTKIGDSFLLLDETLKEVPKEKQCHTDIIDRK